MRAELIALGIAPDFGTPSRRAKRQARGLQDVSGKRVMVDLLVSLRVKTSAFQAESFSYHP